MNIDLLSQLTILFVDDDEDIVKIVEGFLNHFVKILLLHMMDKKEMNNIKKMMI